MAALLRRGVPAFQLDASLLERSHYYLTDEAFAVTQEGAEFIVPRDGAVRGWIRRLAPPQWRRDAAPASHAGAMRASWVALLIAVARACSITWISDLERLFIAENKLVQQTAARDLGIHMPRSVVTSSRERIPADLGDSLVVKPLGPGQFTSDEGLAQVLYARELAREAPELDALGGAPFLVQERLLAESHLRVVTVEDHTWVCALEANELPLDWRRVDEAHDAFAATDAYGEVGKQAVRLARHLGVGYSSQDWVVAGGTPYLLDLNPGGQWLFLPEPVSSAVTAAIATWLAGAREPQGSGQRRTA